LDQDTESGFFELLEMGMEVSEMGVEVLEMGLSFQKRV
jgi:hypothetical protein